MTLRPFALGVCSVVAFAGATWVVAQDRPAPGAPDERPGNREVGPATRPQDGRDGPRGFGPGGFGGGPMGGPMGGQERKLVEQFDKDKDGRLNTEERKDARVAAKAGGRGPGGGRQGGPGFGGPGGPGGGGPGGGGPGGRVEPGKPGPKIARSDVKSYPDLPFYDTSVVRTIFFEFEADDWESELADFIRTDVEVPATMTVDGKTYPNVGVSFRGMSSLMGVPAGSKRSFNVSVDHADAKQRVGGYKSLNLLNNHGDPTLLHTVLYSQIARQYIPAPKANLVKVVVNGESWGLYTNAQQFNKEFVDDFFPEKKSASSAGSASGQPTDTTRKDKTASGPKNMRWKVSGSPGGGGSLAYLGEDPAAYKRLYEIKSDDNDEAWKALITLCRTLNQTPPEKLEAALEPMLNLDSVLWFLALDNVFVNGDGYWTRGSDYSLLRTRDGKFQVIPHDMNETFSAGGGGPGGPGGRGRPGGFPGGPGGFGPGGGIPGGPPQGELPPAGPEGRPATQPAGGPGGNPDVRRPVDADGPRRGPFGPGGFGGPGGGSTSLDPLVGLSDNSKPLRSKLLAVPSLRARYLSHVRTLAEKSLDWNYLGPIVAQYRALIEKEVEADTRKLESYESFKRALDPAEPQPAAAGQAPQPGGGRGTSLRQFAAKRREFLLAHAEVKAAP